MVNVMNDFERVQKEKEYSNLMLRYEVRDVDWAKKTNKENYETLKTIFNEIGIMFNLEDNKLTIGIHGYQFLRMQNRYAGRRRKVLKKKPEPDSCESTNYYRYSDIVYMLKTKKDKEIAEIIGMKIATYYRHKKKMKESSYYKKLNMDSLQDKKYLESLEENYFF